MTKQSAKNSYKEISELLESDDELPDSYDEVPDIPAFQNDNRFERFEPINLDWHLQRFNNINTHGMHAEQQCPQKSESCVTMKTFPDKIINTKDQKKILISKGIMTKQDIFFIKSIEEYSTDKTLLWFIDFLNHKAVKPRQRSCLVWDITEEHYYTAGAKITSSDFKMRYYFKLVVH